MPQLTARGKWVLGWVVVGLQRNVTVPSEAWREYGFRARSRIIFLRGSKRSGGFGVARASQLPALLMKRALGRGQVSQAGQVVVPFAAGIQPGDRLIVVRGSGYALGFLARGPIYEEALKHPELEVFE